jgi:TonB family protein
MRVLLVDHDSEGLEAISRAIRGVLELDCVTSKGDALLLLRQNTYDVLIACERCVDGSGLDLLGRTTRTSTPLKRIFSAPPDRLQLLGPRLAPFKVQRTIAYPIDLEELWLAIAQVTGTSDDTDGTIERVVLDERGIPASGTTPRGPIPPRPPAPLREVRAAPPAPPMPAVAAVAVAGRAAVARMAQPAPEPPLRAPPPPRQPPPAARAVPPASTSDTGRHRLPPSDTGRMRALTAQAAPVAPPEMSSWTPEPSADEFADIAAQARYGVQRKVLDEGERRKRQRLITASVVAVAVAGVIVFLIEKFYDPDARAREAAIAAEVTRMSEQQKVTDSLTLIEVDIEKAIMENNLDLARQELARLVEQAPAHPRREFLQASIDRAAELTKLSAQSPSREGAGSNENERQASRPRPVERAPARTTERLASRTTDRAPARASDAPARSSRDTAATPPPRTFGAPIGETVERTLPLNAPINAPPTATTTTRRPDNSFGGRTVEASDNQQGNSTTPLASQPSNPNAAGSAAVQMPPAATPAPAQVPATAANVQLAKIVKRVAPVAPAGTPAKTAGFVVVQYTITEQGRVTDVAVVESSPMGMFDSAAQSAVRKWLYEPRKEDGVAVSTTGKARLVFEPAK